MTHRIVVLIDIRVTLLRLCNKEELVVLWKAGIGDYQWNLVVILEFSLSHSFFGA